jgi:hypothetical protein
MGGIKMYLKGTLLLGLLIILVSACFNAPEFPNEPSITFNDIIFKHGATDLDPDSLILTLNFQDGDGDLGLRADGTDTEPPYNDLWFFRNVNYPIGIDSAVKYSDRFTPEYDTLPPYEFPYKCVNYTLAENDTFYVQANEFHNNIYVDFFVKKNGIYTEFDFLALFEPECNPLTFNGRYPVLNEPDPGRARPLEGKLKYSMESAGWELIFRQDTMKLDIYIYDRALNKSNLISTPDFVLKNITVGG